MNERCVPHNLHYPAMYHLNHVSRRTSESLQDNALSKMTQHLDATISAQKLSVSFTPN